MQVPDDEKFELYLKRFHPINPDPIPTLRAGRAFERPLRLGVWVAAIAAILLLGTLVLHLRGPVVVPNAIHDVGSTARQVPLEPLTMRSANAWLTTAPSFKAAIDDLAFRSESDPIPQGKQSAVAVLSEEKTKL